MDTVTVERQYEVDLREAVEWKMRTSNYDDWAS